MSWLARHPELRAQVERVRGEWPEARRDYHYYSEEVVAEFLARIADGRGLAEVCAEPDMPAHASVLRWMGERPEFARRYALARLAQADRLFDLAWAIALEAGEADVKSAALKIATLRWRVGKLAPRRYGAFKATEPPADGAAGGPAGDEAGDKAGGDGRLVIELRRFARRPDGTVAEITAMVRGLSGEAAKALRAEVEAGRLEAPSPAGRPGE
jgi:hypothetical protein